ncbi:hypothetical protein [Helicobacter mesocricetorum]|uniref:hypothetical protein n=1 Tax=Helicobacter mesocricetorum TaxID=87012 RepID=UPI000CF08770|nr:hypothetical protein [Helicobacter mesocricetorum]
MKLFFKVIPTNAFFLFMVFIPLNAENFLEISSNKPTQTLVLMLSQNDQNFIEEMQKYPKNTAFFIDGRTEKIISTNNPPKLPIIQEIPKATPTTPQKDKALPKAKKLQKLNQIPYQMQEERIQLLR